jgi:hypothetical protein
MPDKMKYFQVNWTDGMKINKSHFTSLENSITERINDALQTGINNYNYGLLPSPGSKEVPLKLVLHLDNQQTLRVKVFECSALTPGGNRIDIHETTDIKEFTVPVPETAYEIPQIKQEDLLVCLSVNPFKPVPVGRVDPGEEPLRYPYAVPECRVHLIPGSQLGKTEPGLNFLVIGRIHLAESGPELVRDFIPPCTSVGSHPVLVASHADFERFLGQLELDIVTILKKIKDKEQSNILALTLASVAEPLLYYLCTEILAFRWVTPSRPPLLMFEQIARGARIFKNYLDASSGKAKEELLNYLTEWCSVNQGDFEAMLLRTVNFEYDHNDIRKTLDIMIQYAEVVSSLFGKLSTLEYIGKKKETSIFVKEQTVNKKSFLAD